MKVRVCGNCNKNQYYHGLPLCDRKDFYKFAMRNWELKYMFHRWILSGHKKALLPTPDRLINRKGYALDNIQFLTFRDNQNKR